MRTKTIIVYADPFKETHTNRYSKIRNYYHYSKPRVEIARVDVITF